MDRAETTITLLTLPTTAVPTTMATVAVLVELLTWAIIGTTVAMLLLVLWHIYPRPLDRADFRRRQTIIPPVALPEDRMEMLSDYHLTSKGNRLFYRVYLPKRQQQQQQQSPSSSAHSNNNIYNNSSHNGELKGIVLMIHGYADSVHWFVHGRCIRCCLEGYIVVACDLEGHGFSDGLHVYIRSFDDMVSGCHECFQAQLVKYNHLTSNLFVFGESMGGAVALRMLQMFGQEQWRGAVLMAPMVKIREELAPPKLLVDMLAFLGSVVPTWPLVPSPSLIHLIFKEQSQRDIAMQNPLNYEIKKPRIRTGLELLRCTNQLARTMEDITAPLLILHGTADLVTDHRLSKELYTRASSPDKTMHAYEGMWHCLVDGEPKDNAEKVWRDIFTWMQERLIL